ncbi:penicillin-binding protein 2 [Candidatus Gracilibacteria bacterium]|nr:penicillin-binding protein 2 [Candidatus Gracilibacteria bacterium]
MRLFILQVVNHSYYDDVLNKQHISKSLLAADRGNIYAYDKSNSPVKLTENITLYNIFVDPKFIGEKKKFIDIITPAVYKHLCEVNGMNQVDLTGCVENIETFTNKELFPIKPEFFYYGSGIISTGYFTYDRTGYYNQYSQILSGFTKDIAISLIKSRLDQKIQIGIKTRNYIGFFSNEDFLEELKKLNLNYIDIQYDNYIYIIPNNVVNKDRDALPLKKLLDKYGYLVSYGDFDKNLYPQENRYVKILSDANPIIAQLIKDLKIKYYLERTSNNIPILHGLGLESYSTRYYPYGSFMSNILGFVHKSGAPIYGIEQYFDSILRGKDGKIIGRSSAWLGPVGANEFEIEEVKHGDDVYLTVDIGMQREIESIVKNYNENFRSDSISVLVFDPFSGQIIASVNEPSFDPNNYDDVYNLQPLSPEYGYIVDNLDYLDVPIYIKSSGEIVLAKSYERQDYTLEKYIAKNVYGPWILKDRNISLPYEPGSIFKAFTVGIGYDIDEIRPYDFYNDPGFVKVGPYTIKNVEELCAGDNSFLHALVYSCNVGMVRISQKIGKETFYNYLDKFGFGKLTNIELGGEEEGSMEGVTTVSLAKYFNNAFGQGLLVTPIQIAAGYSALVNGGYYVQPTIVAGIYDKETDIYHPKTRKVVRQIIKPETSELMKDSLFEVMEENPDFKKNVKIEGFTLGGKSGTSQISFKGKYQNGIGWTNASFVGLITKENVKYIVVIQIRRPRKSIWGGVTAGRVFRDVARFIISYNLVEK